MQDNLNSPAFPITETNHPESIDPGFTKLEYASLMVAQGMLSASPNSIQINGQYYPIEKASVIVAKAVLEECNK